MNPTRFGTLDQPEAATIAAAGFVVRLNFAESDAGMIGYMQDRFGPAPVVDDEPNLTLDFRRGEPPARFGELLSDDFGIEIHRAGDRSLHAAGRGVALVALPDGTASITHTDDPDMTIVGILATIAMVAGALDAGYQAFHAAVIAEGDRAVLLLGESGQGKSTTSGIAVAAGYDLGGDDVVIVQDGEPPLAAGIPRAPAVPGEIVEDAERWADQTPDGRGRLVLTDADLRVGWTPLCAVLWVRHGTDAETDVVPATPGDIVRQLVRSATAGFDGSDRSATAMASVGRLAGLPSWLLLLGADADQRPDSTRAALERVFAQLD